MKTAFHSVNPIWNIENGWIQPTKFPKIPLLAQQIRQIIRNDNSGDTAIFLRGSLLENEQPHHKSDIDILVLSRKFNISLLGYSATSFPQTEQAFLKLK